MENYIYIYFVLISINAVSIISVQLYLMLFVVPALYKKNHMDYQRLVHFFIKLRPLSLADTLSRYFIPLYGVFMSLYLIYLLSLKDYVTNWSMSSRFKYAERELQKFRIFKRKNKWKKYYCH